MKNVFLTISILVLLFSCKKEEPVPEEENFGYSGHYAYIKGNITDSLTGAPISGYNIQVSGPNTETDTLIDGSYSTYVHWFYSHYSYPKPTSVDIFMMDSTNSVVHVITFDATPLVENDTTYIDFQVTL